MPTSVLQVWIAMLQVYIYNILCCNAFRRLCTSGGPFFPDSYALYHERTKAGYDGKNSIVKCYLSEGNCYFGEKRSNMTQTVLCYVCAYFLGAATESGDYWKALDWSYC